MKNGVFEKGDRVRRIVGPDPAARREAAAGEVVTVFSASRRQIRYVPNRGAAEWLYATATDFELVQDANDLIQQTAAQFEEQAAEKKAKAKELKAEAKKLKAAAKALRGVEV